MSLSAQVIDMSEIKKVISDFEKRRIRIDRTFKSLQAEKEDLENMHRILSEALMQTNRKIGDQTVCLSRKLQQNVIVSEEQIRKVGKETTMKIEKKADQLNDFLKSSKAAITNLKGDLKVFEKHMSMDVSTRFDEILKKQHEFQKTMMENVIRTLSRETLKMKQAMKQDNDGKIDAFVRRQNQMVDNLTQQMELFDQQVAELRAELEEVRTGQAAGESKITEYIKKIFRKNTDYQRKVKSLDERVLRVEADLGKRVEMLEEKMEEIRQIHRKKKQFSFFGKSRPENGAPDAESVGESMPIQ